MQRDGDGGLARGALDQEGGQARVIGGLVAQRLHQLQQHAAHLLVLAAPQHRHRRRAHLSQRRQGIRSFSYPVL